MLAKEREKTKGRMGNKPMTAIHPSMDNKQPKGT
jgi:hypothetical protein